MPQPPDPYALHEATLAKLQQQAAGERSAPTARSKSALRSTSTSTPTSTNPADVTSVRTRRTQAQNRAEAPEGATNVFGSATGAIYDLGALLLSIAASVVKFALIGGTKLFAGMFNAAHWVMHEITGGD